MTATNDLFPIRKERHFDGAIRRLVFKQVGVIPVDREEGGKEALKGAIEIEGGGAIFQGTRSGGKMGKGKTGVDLQH